MGRKLSSVCHFFGCQARGSLPSKIDCDYAYVRIKGNTFITHKSTRPCYLKCKKYIISKSWRMQVLGHICLQIIAAGLLHGYSNKSKGVNRQVEMRCCSSNGVLFFSDPLVFCELCSSDIKIVIPGNDECEEAPAWSWSCSCRKTSYSSFSNWPERKVIRVSRSFYYSLYVKLCSKHTNLRLC